MKDIKLIGLVILVGAAAFLAGCWENTGGNQPPKAVISFEPHRGYAPLEATFDASGSVDPDGEIVAYEWDFGDGESASGVQVVHTFADDGNYTVRLTVYDDEGATDSATVQVEVQNPPPVARFTFSPENPVVGEPVTFDASTSVDPATGLGTNSIVSYHWAFGDGHEGTGVVVEHIYNLPGNYTVTLTIMDDDGASATGEETILVSPPQPPPPPSG